MSGTVLSRRQLLRLGGATLGGALLAACQPKVVEKVVKETVIVEVEKEAEVVEKVVKETVIVEKEAPKEPITLNFLNRGGEYIANVMDRQMKLYQETNPDIQFEINAVVGAQHQEALLMMLSAGTGPDCWFDANRTTGMLAQKGIALDLEPYLEATAAAHPDLRDVLFGLSRRTGATRLVMVHGDVSPKNILLGPDGPVFLDAECACIGDPAFDLAFCLNHMLLKCLWNPAAREGFHACFEAMVQAYLGEVAWEPAAAVERRTASLLPGLFLARVDGKSPVEYIRSDGDRDRVRRCARGLLVAPPSRLADVLAAWKTELNT